MDFLAQYGLFLLKSLTLVISILFVIGGLLAMTKKAKPKLEIVSLNKAYDDIKQQMNHEVKDHKKKRTKLNKTDKKSLKDKPILYLIDFNGDIRASQVEQLREEITAVLAVAQEKDEIVIKIESPGGSVNGYGLAASQLQRIRDKNIPLTVCVDRVAASGAYLMSCVANYIVAAPFAIVGSIGVVAQLPNFHRWLKKNYVDMELITAGEYKRTLTMLGENTDKGRKKFQEDLEKIHQAFRNYVLTHREQLNIDEVSTGEHWLAIDAFNLKLIDCLKTSDDYLIEKMIDYNIFKVTKYCKQSIATKLFKPIMLIVNDWLGNQPR